MYVHSKKPLDRGLFVSCLPSCYALLVQINANSAHALPVNLADIQCTAVTKDSAVDSAPAVVKSYHITCWYTTTVPAGCEAHTLSLPPQGAFFTVYASSWGRIERTIRSTAFSVYVCFHLCAPFSRIYRKINLPVCRHRPAENVTCAAPLFTVFLILLPIDSFTV